MLRGSPRAGRGSGMPRAYAVRDRLIGCVRKGHEWAAEQEARCGVKHEGEEDPFYGCKFFRERRETLSVVDNCDADALASEDFRSIWG